MVDFVDSVLKITQSPLQEAFFTVQDLLQAFIQNQGFQVETLALAFGTNINMEMLRSLEQQFSQGDFTVLPEIEVRSAEELSGALGVYLQEQDRIFLSEAFLARASQDRIVAVILEEIGHAIDARLNTVDSSGDEGAIFSALVRGVELSAVELQNLQTENDSITVEIDGQTLIAEAASNVTVNSSQALSLDGVDASLAIPDSDAIDFGTNQDFTVEAWIKADANQVDLGNGDNDIIEKWSVPGGSYPFVIRYYRDQGKIIAARYDGTNNPAIVSTATIDDEQFHHVAFVKDGGTLKLYINGQLDGSTADTTTGNTQNNYPLYLGSRNTDNYFKGEVDDLRLWNIARTEAEIQAKLNQQLSGAEAGLVGYYTFDDGTATDLVNGNDGSFTGGATTVESLIGRSLTATATEDDASFSVDLLSNVSQANSSAANVTLVSGDESGVTVNGNSLDIDPSAYNSLVDGESEVIEYSYDITDGNGGSVSQTAAVTINGVNDAPTVPSSQAFSFDGINSGIHLGTSEDLRFEGTAAYTLEAWIKPEAAGTVLSNPSIYRDYSGGYALDVQSDGRIRSHRGNVVWDQVNHTNHIDNPVDLYSSSTINFNQWNHIATTYDGQTLSLYINGEFAGSTLAGSSNNNRVFTLIGANYNLQEGYVNPFLGDIDSVRFWDLARSQAQIQQDANRHLSGSEAGLVAYYTFDDGTATDLSDSGHDGTLWGVAPVEGKDPEVLTVNISQGDSNPTVDLLAEASDPDAGDSLNVTNLTDFRGDAGGITLNGNTLEIDPDYYVSLGAGESEVVHYIYDITDGNGGTVTRNAVVQIEGVNDAPIAPPLTVLLPGDAVTFDFDLIDYDPTNATDGIQDPEGDTLAASNLVKVSGNDTGVTLNGTTVTIDPSAYAALKSGESEVIEYSYDVSDGSATVSTGISFAIQGVNDAPTVSSAVTASADEDSNTVIVDLLAGATDPENDTLNVANVTLQSGNGSGVTINGNTLEIDPNQYELPDGQSGTVTYSYDITDGNGGTVSQTANLTINGVTDTAADIGQAGIVSLAQIADEQNPIGFVINASQPNAAFGFSASTAGDVNNDGFVDLIIGAPRSSSATIPSGFDLSTNPSSAVEGDLTLLAPGVDQNGDGFFDITHVNGVYSPNSGANWDQFVLSHGVLSLNSFQNSDNLFWRGERIIYTPNSDINLADGEILEETFTLRMTDDKQNTVGPFRDVEIKIAIVGGSDKGGAYVIYGKGDGSAIDLQSLGNQGFVLSGGTPGANAGLSVSGGRDLNGDDLPDFLVGEPFGGSGQAYGVFNSGQGNNVSLQEITSDSNPEGFNLSQANLATGYSVSLADVNGNGLADMIIGSPLANGGHGKVSVVFDRTDGSTVDLTTLGQGNNQGFEITYPNFFGRTTSSAGDFNGDGYEDLIVGHLANRFVVFGKEDTLNVQAGSDFTINAGASPAVLGASTWNSFFSGGGDINGDGLSDVIVTERAAVPNRISVVFGQASGSSVSLDTIAAEGGGGFSITYDGASPVSVAPSSRSQDVTGVGGTNYKLHKAHILGDIDGDGLDDLAINFSNSSDVGSKVYVVFGKSDFTTIDLAQPLSSDQGFVIQGNIDAGDASNTALNDQDFFESIRAGDVNGDGLADILITAPFDNADDAANDNAGKSYVLFGGDFTGTISQQGSNGDDTFSGTTAIDSFIGGLGNDTLLGAGGSDVLYGGAGNDVLGVADTTFQRIDGGLGEDTLQLTGSGITLDFETARGFIREIERIDLTGSGNNTLSLASRDVANLSQSSNRLIVTGDAGDTLNSLNQDWVLAPGGSTVSLPEFVGSTFQHYIKGDLELFIDTDISANIGVPVLDAAFNLDENSTNGTDVGNVGNGTSGNSYTFLSGNESGAFSIDSNGQITVADSTKVDFEAGDRLTLTVQVTDAANLSDTGIVTVLLNDVNDYPVFAPVNSFDPLPEHSLVGTYVGSVPATDQDAGDAITYSITNGNPNGIFSINDQTGDLYVANAALLDYETQASYDLTIEATDLQGASSQTNVTVNLEDRNQLSYQNAFTFSAQNQSIFGPTAEAAATIANNFANDLNQIAPSESFAWLSENNVNNSVDLNTDFTLTTGEYDASLPIELQVVLPDNILPGQPLLLKSAAKLQDWATLNAESPSLNVDLGLDINVTPQLNLGNFFGQDVQISGLGTLNLNALINSPIDVEASATLDAPVLTNSTSQVSDFTSAISAQLQEANWAQPEIAGTVEMFNLWDYLIANLGIPNGLSLGTGGSNITVNMSPGTSPYGTVAAYSSTNASEKIWEVRYAEPGSALAEGGLYPHGWEFSYYGFGASNPLDTLVWTGDHLAGRFSLYYNTAILPPLTSTSLHASGTWDSAVTHIDYVNLDPNVEQQLDLNQNLNLGLDTVAGQIIFTELAEGDANRVQDFTSSTTTGTLTSANLAANLINVPDNADVNGDGIVEVDTRINPEATLTNYAELAYDLNARLVGGQVNVHTDITIASSSDYEIYPSYSPAVYQALRTADSDSSIRRDYNGNTYYHYIDIHQSTGPVIDSSVSHSVVQPVFTATNPDFGSAQSAFNTGANTGNGLSLVVHEDTPSVSGSVVPADSPLATGYTFEIVDDPAKGLVNLQSDGNFTYNLDNAFQGLATGDYEDITFTYTATNGPTTENGFVTVIVEGDDGVANKYHDGTDVDFYLWDNTAIDTAADTYVITHGWRSSSSSEWVADMAKAIQSRPEAANANIILTDWSGLAGNLNYANAAADTYTVGQTLGNFLASEGIDATTTDVHLIGHSLGGHVSGIAGDTYEANATTTGAIDEITGLDPAGPLFEDSISLLNNPSRRLDASDADRVSIFHTTSTLGYDGALGDVDFYVNPDDLLQPNQSDPIGNHSYGYQLYTELLNGVVFNQDNNSPDFGYGSIDTLNGNHNIDTTMPV